MEHHTIGVVYHDEYIGNDFYARQILIRNIYGHGWGFPEFTIKSSQSITESFLCRLEQETEGRYRIEWKESLDFTIIHEGQLVKVYIFDFEGHISSKSGISYIRVVNDVMPYQFTTLAKIILNRLPQPEIKKSPQLWQTPTYDETMG